MSREELMKLLHTQSRVTRMHIPAPVRRPNTVDGDLLSHQIFLT